MNEGKQKTPDGIRGFAIFVNLKSTNIMKVEKGMEVWLKSGGPKMTVNSKSTSMGGAGKWFCQWFVKDKLEGGTFDESQLTDADPNISAGTIGR